MGGLDWWNKSYQYGNDQSVNKGHLAYSQILEQYIQEWIVQKQLYLQDVSGGP